MDVTGRNVVVTGGGNGIGRALCERFAQEGARHVTVVDLDEGDAAAVAQSIGGTARGADVGDRDSVVELAGSIEAAQGPIDLFVSNAGILVPGSVEASVDDWQKIWDVNVMAHVHAAHALIPGMLERGEGTFLNTCSAAGLLTQIGSAPYSVTKHASVAFAEWLSITYGDRGIKVFALCPQAVNTAMTAGTEAGGVAGVDGMLEPADIAEAVIQGLAAESFLILPHESVRTYFQRKAGDYDRWIKGMRKLNAQFLPEMEKLVGR